MTHRALGFLMSRDASGRECCNDANGAKPRRHYEPGRHTLFNPRCASEKRHVPGKLFEYLRSGKPILAFGDVNQEVQRILKETQAGMIFPMMGGNPLTSLNNPQANGHAEPQMLPTNQPNGSSVTNGPYYTIQNGKLVEVR